MTPAARVQAAIELLDQIVAAARANGAPADRIVADGLRARRYAGSKDRRAIRDLTYAAIRACGPLPESGRAAMLRLAGLDAPIGELFDGSDYGPARLEADEQAAVGGIAPRWLEARLAASGIAGDEALALLSRAPLDIRVNRLKAKRDELELPLAGELLPVPDGLRYPNGTQVEQWAAYHAGWIEVQDCGSQIACLAAGAQPGETVVDLCAGAGGKTLALAAAMDNRGTLIAADTDRSRLSRMGPRAERAGAAVAETVLLDPKRERTALAPWLGGVDLVLVDAPCSGVGTWRRNPEARWRLDPQQLARLTDLQAYLLDLAADLAGPRGRITYITCSLLDEEGRDQVEGFLAAHPDWRAEAPELPLGTPHGQGIRLTPQHDATDGFFIACLFRA
ncbi:MAG: RsmB/NOP family class I SAM-dependent RNA methyltransferase [Candidatus Andeanibacterium colombiense]|uniref:RsmB/NOP family class I SAM-dependent RNA methyltransferase n=1 Tax=Candidatus Andeanibacterium colombiense TaxID=3121345 RepID=A0AAJ5X760_9SPHN|nr:MAG: RsmB/NOP family class I SAM-dependent RNA methyltransferase [Sphingomonadaceae bacterium]